MPGWAFTRFVAGAEALGNGTQALRCGPLSRFGAERRPFAALPHSRTLPRPEVLPTGFRSPHASRMTGALAG